MSDDTDLVALLEACETDLGYPNLWGQILSARPDSGQTAANSDDFTVGPL